MKTMKLSKLPIKQHVRAFMWGILLLPIILCSKNVCAQADAANAGGMPQLQGFYQFPNKVAFIEFEWKDSVLFAKQLWDNKTYQLIQVDGVNFESKAEGYKITFIKDGSGHFNQAKILGRIMTTKVDFDPREVAQLTTEQLGRLEGTYIAKDDQNLKISIRSSGTGLLLGQLWDHKEIAFTPRSATFFLNEDGTFPLLFLLENERVIQVTCFENDVWLKERE